MSEGQLFRPDRICVDDKNNVVIIDYKTGSYQESHTVQLKQYAKVIRTMGYIVKHQILIYFDKKIKIMYA